MCVCRLYGTRICYVRQVKKSLALAALVPTCSACVMNGLTPYTEIWLSDPYTTINQLICRTTTVGGSNGGVVFDAAFPVYGCDPWRYLSKCSAVFL